MLTEIEKATQTERLRGQLEMAKLYAQYWITSAQTGNALGQKLYHGTNGAPFTDAEKITSALNTALIHVHRIDELTEALITLMEEPTASRAEQHAAGFVDWYKH